MPPLTTNQFARKCLSGEETDFGEDAWHLAACPFLTGGLCSIYPVRPFGCRSFGSLVSCAQTGSAEVPSLLLTVNTVFMQIIEHIDQGQPWGNMIDILALLQAEGKGRDAAAEGLRRRLAVSEPLPGLLIPPEEEAEVSAILADLYERDVAGRPFRAWLMRAGE